MQADTSWVVCLGAIKADLAACELCKRGAQPHVQEQSLEEVAAALREKPGELLAISANRGRLKTSAINCAANTDERRIHLLQT